MKHPVQSVKIRDTHLARQLILDELFTLSLYSRLRQVSGPKKGIRARVLKARRVQIERYQEDGIFCNSQLKPKHFRKFCELDQASRQLIETAMEKLGLSARAYNRILKVSRTIAELDASKKILSHHVSEVISYRNLDRRNRL